MNLPNALTLSRIFLVPVLLAVLLTKNVFPFKELIAAVIVAVAGITDSLDGYLARRMNKVTTLGILLDPIADKLLVSAAFISMVEMGLVKAWVVVLIVGREMAITGLRGIAQAGGHTIAVSDLGKTKTVMQIVAIVALLLGVNWELAHWVGQIALIAVVILALVSALLYFLQFWKNVGEEVKVRRSRLQLLRALRRQRTKSGVVPTS
jgi:CDP-diacylglycerol--glycerol-3-phosphate 3-phosphatidyltransferase